MANKLSTILHAFLDQDEFDSCSRLHTSLHDLFQSNSLNFIILL